MFPCHHCAGHGVGDVVHNALRKVRVIALNFCGPAATSFAIYVRSWWRAGNLYISVVETEKIVFAALVRLFAVDLWFLMGVHSKQHRTANVVYDRAYVASVFHWQSTSVWSVEQ